MYTIPPLAQKFKEQNSILEAWIGIEPMYSSFAPLPFFHMEATIGIEPMYSSFADCCLTTWLRRHKIFTVGVPRRFISLSRDRLLPYPDPRFHVGRDPERSVSDVGATWLPRQIILKLFQPL